MKYQAHHVSYLRTDEWPKFERYIFSLRSWQFEKVVPFTRWAMLMIDALQWSIENRMLKISCEIYALEHKSFNLLRLGNLDGNERLEKFKKIKLKRVRNHELKIYEASFVHKRAKKKAQSNLKRSLQYNRAALERLVTQCEREEHERLDKAQKIKNDIIALRKHKDDFGSMIKRCMLHIESVVDELRKNYIDTKLKM